jgi:hypothetical protein
VKADGENVAMKTGGGRSVELPWGDVSGLYFRRKAFEGVPTEGLLARVEWRPAHGAQVAELDFAEGAIIAVNDAVVTIATPYSGLLSIPRELLSTLTIQGYGRRYLLDATAHHLGDELSTAPPVLDPPEPEGGVFERSVELDKVPAGSWFVVLDVVEVLDEHSSEFAPRVRNGEFRSYVHVNGQRIDYLNRHVQGKHEKPERLTVAVPAGLVRAGKNTIRLELSGAGQKEAQLDDLGILLIALDARIANPAAGKAVPVAR